MNISSKEDARLYEAYSSIVRSVRNFAAARSLIEVLPAPVAIDFEFPPERSFSVKSETGAEMVLPASNTYQKEMAAHYLGAVFCIAPCYRNEAPDPLHGNLTLPVFHQIEMEKTGTDFQEAMDLAQELLAHIIRGFPASLTQVPNTIFDAIETIDLTKRTVPFNNLSEYDDWSYALSLEAKRPLWISHTPQTPAPWLNKKLPETRLTLGFDLMLPHGHGEILSGGERDKDQMKSFFGISPAAEIQGSSGFGIGLERLLTYFLNERQVRDVILPHHRIDKNQFV